MQNLLKEYAFVVISIVGALVFFFLLKVMLRHDSETSVVNMLKSSMQYVDAENYESASTNYGRDVLDNNLKAVTTSTTSLVPDFYFNDTTTDDGKQYKLSNTDYLTSSKSETIEDADGSSVKVAPAIYTLTSDFLLDKLKVRNGGVTLSDITITVIDYTPALIYPEDGTTSITGRIAPDEDVIEVDKYGNKIVDSSSPDGYKHTTRTQYQQRNQVDSSILAADDYDDYYGQTYFYRKGTWYYDSDLNGSLTITKDSNGNETILDSKTGPLDLGLNNKSYDGKNGIKFNTDIPHKFKVIYRVNGKTTNTNVDSAALKAEMTKIFVAVPRNQVKRSLVVYEENYEDGVLKGKDVDKAPTEKNLLTSNVADYSGLTSEELLNSLAESKLAAVQAWQDEERAERAEAESERKAAEEAEKKKAKALDTLINTDTNTDTENTETTESTETTEGTENVEG